MTEASAQDSVEDKPLLEQLLLALLQVIATYTLRWPPVCRKCMQTLAHLDAAGDFVRPCQRYVFTQPTWIPRSEMLARSAACCAACKSICMSLLLADLPPLSWSI